MSRPEHQNPPEIFYNDTEAKKYATSSRMIEIQTKMADRAIELLALPEGPGKLILDIGCGTGLSGDVVQKNGHYVIGIDISHSMLEVARERGAHEKQCDVLEWDMGTGFGFRYEDESLIFDEFHEIVCPGCFDGIISISALQWLCNADSSNVNPIKRINRFFNTLYGCMSRGSRAVFQFYPENPEQVELLTSAALRAGFTGGLLVDYPNSAKAKKYFLVLMAGQLPGQTMPKAKEGDEEEVNTVRYEAERKRRKGQKKEKPKFKSREWILAKKERRRLQGKETRPDSKYTGRSRGPKF